jgi:hypothetical protein
MPGWHRLEVLFVGWASQHCCFLDARSLNWKSCQVWGVKLLNR